MKEKYKIYKGDILEQIKSIPTESINSIITDPPYAVKMAGWDEFESNKHYEEWCNEWGNECFRILKPGGAVLSFSAARTYHRLAVGLEDAGFHTRDMLEWIYWASFAKGKTLKPGHEPIYYGIKPPITDIIFNLDNCRIPMTNKQENEIEKWLLKNQPIKPRADIWTNPNKNVGKEYNAVVGKKEKAWKHTTNPPHPGGRVPYNVLTSYGLQTPNFIDVKKPRGTESIPGHPTQKPIKLMEWLIRLTSNENDIIVDPFAGTGTTGEAALLLNRQVILIEREEEYLKIIQKRVETLPNASKVKSPNPPAVDTNNELLGF